ncbi:hypothetical protein [Phormidesmis sp. 146-33]
MNAEPLPLDFVTQQFQAERVWVAVHDRDTPVGYAIAQEIELMDGEALGANWLIACVLGQNIRTIAR